MQERSLNLFQKRDDYDELEGFQQQELAKVKHMVRQLGRDRLLCNVVLVGQVLAWSCPVASRTVDCPVLDLFQEDGRLVA